VLAASLLLVACNNNDDQESNCTIHKPIKILSNENALPTSTRLKSYEQAPLGSSQFLQS
jgi:hypothetical protein